MVQRAYDLALWLVHKVEKFPRSFRFSVGDRVIARALDLLEALTEAAYTSDKVALLDWANRVDAFDAVEAFIDGHGAVVVLSECSVF